MEKALFPAFLKLQGRRVVVVGGGPVAASKLASLQAAGADVIVVAPDVCDAIRSAGVAILQKRFEPSDLERRLVRGRGGTTAGESSGGRRGRAPACFRQCGRRSLERERLSRRRGPSRRRDARDLHRRCGTGACGAAARSTRFHAARRSRQVECARTEIACRRGVRAACRWKRGVPNFSRR